MSAGRRRAHAAFNDANEGFIEAWRGLQAITAAHGTLDEQMQELCESIKRLFAMILAQSDELRTQSQTIRERIERLKDLP
jgi:predicted metal-dependent hydrolase